MDNITNILASFNIYFWLNILSELITTYLQKCSIKILDYFS